MTIDILETEMNEKDQQIEQAKVDLEAAQEDQMCIRDRVELEYNVPLLAFGMALSQAGMLAFLAVTAAEFVWVPAQSWRRERAGLRLGKQGHANA